MADPRKIRPIALAVIRHGDTLLVFRGHDHVKGKIFYRPLGGGIEFGETAEQAVRREVVEEIEAELGEVTLLQVVENLFVLDGEPGHEVIFLFKATFTDPALLGADFIGAQENGAPIDVIWMPLDAFRHGEVPLYPDALLAIAERF